MQTEHVPLLIEADLFSGAWLHGSSSCSVYVLTATPGRL
jgi:hypothetical protein